MPPPTMTDVPIHEIYEVLNFCCERLRAAPVPEDDEWSSYLEALAAVIDKLKNVSGMVPVPSINVGDGRLKSNTRGSRVIVGCAV